MFLVILKIPFNLRFYFKQKCKVPNIYKDIWNPTLNLEFGLNEYNWIPPVQKYTNKTSSLGSKNKNFNAEDFYISCVTEEIWLNKG